MKIQWLLCLLTALFGCRLQAPEPVPAAAAPPNIVLFYVDDLGYGDLGCYGATGVATPHADRLAREGIRFTDAHSAAATCTPSRFALLTGTFAFRSQAAVLPGDAPLLIRPGIPTLPSLLQQAGYRTGVVGKWHLGLGDGNTDWNGEVRPGPLEIGFDYSFLLPATGDRVPTVYLEDHRVVGLTPEDSLRISYRMPFPGVPTGMDQPERLRQAADPQHSQAIVNGISRIGYQTGGASALWTDEDFPDIFTDKARAFIASAADQPFFLFFSFHDIHVPRLPHPRFQGASEMGPRGDAIAQMDWMTGVILEELQRQGLTENTLVLFTSDNGPVLNDGYEDQAVERLGAHQPAGPFRGGKYSAFEAGTRVPLIACWPGTITPGESHALISQTDFFASLATLAGVPLPEGAAPDSQDLSQALTRAGQPGSTLLLEEAMTLALRHGPYKYIPPSALPQAPAWLQEKGIEAGLSPLPQLYHLEEDPGETHNLAPQMPKRLERMQQLLDSLVAFKHKNP